MAGRSMVVLVLALVVLNSCASIYRYTLEPETPGNPSDWVADDDSAVVFVGVAGDATIQYLDVNGSDLKAYGYLQGYGLSAVAVHVKAGGDFQVTRASLGFTGPGSYLKETFFHFEGELPTMSIDEPGTYLYGTIIVQGERAYFTQENTQELVAAARRDHPTVFRQLRPVNFMTF